MFHCARVQFGCSIVQCSELLFVSNVCVTGRNTNVSHFGTEELHSISESATDAYFRVGSLLAEEEL